MAKSNVRVIGLTGGIWDLFHKGHKAFLKNAASLCDYIYIAVGSDWITKVQKGIDRPINKENKRLADIEKFIKDEKINGRAFITDLIDFSAYKDFIDVMFIGEDNHSLRFEGVIIRLKRTEGISTTKLIKERVKNGRI